MKRIILLCLLLLSVNLMAQFSIQGYTGNKGAEVLAILDRDFGNRWNYFASGTAFYEYGYQQFNAELYQNLSYYIGENWGYLPELIFPMKI